MPVCRLKLPSNRCRRCALLSTLPLRNAAWGSQPPRSGDSVQEEAVETRTIKPALPDAPPVELPPLPTEFPPLPDIKLPVIQEVWL